jgi:hypothetical protein
VLRRCAILIVLLFAGLASSGFSSPAVRLEENGNPWWIWILVLAALVAFAAVAIWWWMRSFGKEEEEMVSPPKPEPAAPPSDDLKRIEGIGPKISAVLQAAGITTFTHLAATNADQLRQILEATDPRLLRLADPTTWPQQAELAADGEWNALEELQNELKGGRRA